MSKQRSFSEEGIRKKADDYHGLAHYVRTQPDIGANGVKSVNIGMNFEEALRLSLAIQSCLMQLNRYNRARAAGREMGLLLSIKTDSKSITVIETPVPPAEEEKE